MSASRPLRCKMCGHRVTSHGIFGCNYSIPMLSKISREPEIAAIRKCPCSTSSGEIRLGWDQIAIDKKIEKENA
jgi:hypothetical protein